VDGRNQIYGGSHDQKDASLSFPRRRESICSIGASVIPAHAGMTLACPKLYDYGYKTLKVCAARCAGGADF